MSLKVHLALDGNDGVRAAIADELRQSDRDMLIELTNRIGSADAVVASTAQIADLPNPLPSRVKLFLLVDCGGAQAFTDSRELVIANVAHVLVDRAAAWVAVEVQQAVNQLREQGVGERIQIGVIGVGVLGTALVKRLKSGGIKGIESVVVSDVRTPRQGLLRELEVRRSTLDLLLSTSDIVLPAVHHGPTADPLIGVRELRLMGPDARIINASGVGIVATVSDDARESKPKLRLVVRPLSDRREDVAECAVDVAAAIVGNLVRLASNEPIVGIVEHIDFPSAGDPAFWSSRMSPAQSSD